jgi:hypothetical protein
MFFDRRENHDFTCSIDACDLSTRVEPGLGVRTMLVRCPIEPPGIACSSGHRQRQTDHLLDVTKRHLRRFGAHLDQVVPEGIVFGSQGIRLMRHSFLKNPKPRGQRVFVEAALRGQRDQVLLCLHFRCELRLLHELRRFAGRFAGELHACP